MILIQNLTKFRIHKKSFTQVAKKVLFWENKEKETVSFVFVGKSEIRNLNKKFRKKDTPTDVLSFNLNEKDHFGEIVICPEVVKENAKKYGVSFKYELFKMSVHGILHLLGYDHERSEKDEVTMEEKQNKYLNNLKEFS